MTDREAVYCLSGLAIEGHGSYKKRIDEAEDHLMGVITDRDRLLSRVRDLEEDVSPLKLDA